MNLNQFLPRSGSLITRYASGIVKKETTNSVTIEPPDGMIAVLVSLTGNTSANPTTIIVGGSVAFSGKKLTNGDDQNTATDTFFVGNPASSNLGVGDAGYYIASAIPPVIGDKDESIVVSLPSGSTVIYSYMFLERSE